MKKGILFGSFWALAVLAALGASYFNASLSSTTGGTSKWTDTGSNIRPTTPTYAVRIIGNLTLEDVLFEDATTSGNIGMAADTKITIPDGASTGPITWTFNTSLIYNDGLSSGCTYSTSAVTMNDAFDTNTMVFDFPVPARMCGAKVIIDNVRIDISGTDNANYIARTRLMWAYRGVAGCAIYRGREANGSQYAQLVGDYEMQDQMGYWVQMDWESTDSQPDESAYQMLVRAHLE